MVIYSSFNKKERKKESYFGKTESHNSKDLERSIQVVLKKGKIVALRKHHNLQEWTETKQRWRQAPKSICIGKNIKISEKNKKVYCISWKTQTWNNDSRQLYANHPGTNYVSKFNKSCKRIKFHNCTIWWTWDCKLLNSFIWLVITTVQCSLGF